MIAQPDASDTDRSDALPPPWFAAFNTGTAADLKDLVDEAQLAVDWYMPGESAPAGKGLAAVDELMHRLRSAVADLSLAVDGSPLTQRTLTVWRWRARGRLVGPFMGMQPTGSAIELPGAFLVRTVAGRIIELSIRVSPPHDFDQPVSPDRWMRTRTSETILPYSVEGFLSSSEIAFILGAMDEVKRNAPPGSIYAGAGGKSVHNVPNVDIKLIVERFEPKGRVEIGLLPNLVVELLDAAFYRRLADIRRAFPSASWANHWFYCEYGPDQFCAAHIDGNHDGKKVSGCTIRLTDDAEGGEFFVETTGSSDLWMNGPQGPTTVPVAAIPGVMTIPTTRWVSQQAAGTAIMYGGQLTHGTLPVRRGIVKKVLAFVYSPMGR
jgi:hypothetical protein